MERTSCWALACRQDVGHILPAQINKALTKSVCRNSKCAIALFKGEELGRKPITHSLESDEKVDLEESASKDEIWQNALDFIAKKKKKGEQ
jgi:hypothetical protein